MAKLLLADDSVTIQRVIELTFADENIQVVAVGDGRQAIDRVQTEQPDIVLADIGMPERDGYEVAAFIKGNPQFAHIPVLLLTGAFEPVDEGRARAVKCDGVLVKPFEPQMVISRVRDLLSKVGSSASAPSAPVSTPAPAPPADVPPPAASDVEEDSLEAYFDRLDAALATRTRPAPPQVRPAAPAPAPTPTPPAPSPARAPGASAVSRPVAPAVPPPASEPEPEPGAADALAGWDPDLPGSPARSVPAPPSPPPAAARAEQPPPSEPVRPAAAPQQPAPSPVPPDSQPSLTEAFAALLAAEQGQPASSLATLTAPVFQAPVVSDQMIDDIVGRVIARLGDESMRRAVLDAAERLVREEIDRIKQSAR